MRYCMRCLFIALLFTSGLLASVSKAQDAKLAVKLGPDEKAWQVGPYQGTLLDAKTIDADGHPASDVGPSGMVLNTTAPIERDTELVIRVRIAPPKGLGSGLTIFPGQKKPGELATNPLFLQLHVYP